jgi:hypothetical protein
MCNTWKNNGPKVLYAEYLSFIKFSNASVFTDGLVATPNNHTNIGPKAEDRRTVIHFLNDLEGSFGECYVPEQNISDHKCCETPMENFFYQLQSKKKIQ